jgi:hypothetical protein
MRGTRHHFSLLGCWLCATRLCWFVASGARVFAMPGYSRIHGPIISSPYRPIGCSTGVVEGCGVLTSRACLVALSSPQPKFFS